MSDIQNPTTMSDFDFLEFEGFASKVENEGFGYAAENYSPTFESPELNERAADLDGLRALYREYEPAVAAWYDTVGGERACELHNAHVDEERMRGEADRLWAVHPGGDWNYRPYLEAFHTREEAETWVAGQARMVEQYGWKPWAGHLLHRDVPGGEWHRVPESA